MSDPPGCIARSSTEQSSHVDHLLGCIESRDNGNSMRYHAANHRCIHCQGTHASEDHHLSVSVPPVCNPGHIGLLLPLEQAQTTTVHNRPHNYKKNTIPHGHFVRVQGPRALQPVTHGHNTLT